ncbi:MAG: hypothetical protein ACK5PF_09350 [bacterium]
MLAVTVPLGAAARGTALAGASLQIRVPLGAAALAQASAGAVLSLAVSLSAQAQEQALASAGLVAGSATVTLQANGQAVATVQADLTVVRAWMPLAGPRRPGVAQAAPSVREPRDTPARPRAVAPPGRLPQRQGLNRSARVQTRARR